MGVCCAHIYRRYTNVLVRLKSKKNRDYTRTITLQSIGVAFQLILRAYFTTLCRWKYTHAESTRVPESLGWSDLIGSFGKGLF